MSEEFDVTKEVDMPHPETHGSEDEQTEEEYEEVDMTNNELYQVLSVFFEDKNGVNLCEILNGLKTSIDAQNTAIQSQTQVLFEIGKLMEKKLHKKK